MLEEIVQTRKTFNRMHEEHTKMLRLLNGDMNSYKQN